MLATKGEVGRSCFVEFLCKSIFGQLARRRAERRQVLRLTWKYGPTYSIASGSGKLTRQGAGGRAIHQSWLILRSTNSRAAKYGPKRFWSIKEEIMNTPLSEKDKIRARLKIHPQI